MNQEQEPNQIALTSPDGKEARLAELRRLFPDLFDGEGALDEKALRQLVSDEAGHIRERFRFEWREKLNPSASPSHLARRRWSMTLSEA